MGKALLVLMGGGALALGTFGLYNAVTGLNKPPIEREDLTTMGTVTHKECTQMTHRLSGVVLSTDYTFSYSFEATDGQKYSGSHTISEFEFENLEKGMEIEVVYDSHSPGWLHAAKGYGHYTPVDSRYQPTTSGRFMVSLAFMAFGAVFVMGGIQWGKKPQQDDADMNAQLMALGAK